ncbi:MAG: hypothetical protein GY845_37780 [Planctomycetes bacterium]|nr:hypothetical protein [Planctomycetota bacterium]
MKRSEIQGPLLQFQSTIFDSEDIKKLVVSINKRLPENDHLSDTQLNRAYDVWWPHLSSELEKLSYQKGEEQKKGKTSKTITTSMVEEIIEILRQQQRVLNDPESLVPSKHIYQAVKGAPSESSGHLSVKNITSIRGNIFRSLRILTSFFKENPDIVDSKIMVTMVRLYKQYNRLRTHDNLSPRSIPKIFRKDEQTEENEK